MTVIYIAIAVLVVAAIISIIVRRAGRAGEKPTVDTSIISRIYGNVAVPDMKGNIEESLKSQEMLDEVSGAVQDIFAEICGDEAECIGEEKDAGEGSFALTYRVQGQPAPLVFECEHLGKFDLYFQYTDSARTENARGQMSGQYDHTMDKDSIRAALRKVLNI